MRIKESYPRLTEKKLRRAAVIRIARWPFVFAGIGCLAVDFLVSGTLGWSLIAVVSLCTVWDLFVAPDLVDVNRISLIIRGSAWICALLFAVSRAAAWRGSGKVISVVCSAALAVSFVLFAGDYRRQKKNVFPMILLCLVSLGFSIPLFISINGAGRWFYGVSGIVALAVLLASLVILGGNFIRELKKRLHTK